LARGRGVVGNIWRRRRRWVEVVRVGRRGTGRRGAAAAAAAAAAAQARIALMAKGVKRERGAARVNIVARPKRGAAAATVVLEEATTLGV
jgi:hypothetical protein